MNLNDYKDTNGDVELSEQLFSDIVGELQHYNTPRSAPYDSGDNRWRDLSGVGFYHIGSNTTYPATNSTLIHIRLSSQTSITFQMVLGNSGQIWTRRVIASTNFADVEWVAV